MAENKIYYFEDERNNQFESLINTLNFNKNLLYEKKETYDDVFFYVINQSIISGHNDNIILNETILHKLKNEQNFKLLIYSAHESMDNRDFSKLKKYAIENGLEQEKIYLLNNSSNMEELQKINSTNFNFHKLNVLSNVKINDMVSSTESYFEKNKKGKFFITFNKEDKKHRYGLLIFLKKHNLLEETNWSFLPTNKIGIDPIKLEPIFDIETIKEVSTEIDYFQKLKFKFSDYEENNEYNLPNVLSLTMVENFDNYKNSYFNLTTESVFDEREEVIHITEKSFKPFFYYQFPLILSSENHIKKMKELYDFDFYEDVIDYSYDNIKDDKKRFKMYFDEVIRINNNREFFINFYNNNQERFENNKLKVLNVRNLIQKDIEYFKKFYNG